MGRRRSPGLIKRAGIWHVDKKVFGRRLCQSTGTDQLKEAELYLARLTEEIRQASIYGVRPERFFEEAAAKFVLEHQHKRSLNSDIGRLKNILPHLGRIPVNKIHSGILQPWIKQRKEEGVTVGTINHGLKVVRRILNLAATEWVDENGLTWLATAPKIRLLPDTNKRQPYPLNWEEQYRLFSELPDHLVKMSLFAVNTGCRDREICNLQWDWEITVPELGTTVFIIPGKYVKNGDNRLVILNQIAISVINTNRNIHPTHVFTYDGKPLSRMMNSAWLRARKTTNLEQVRVHDLKHTFGRRLRATGVSFEDRQDLLGHRSGRITTHYSAAELSRLIEAANSVCEEDKSRHNLVVLRCATGQKSRKTPASGGLSELYLG